MYKRYDLDVFYSDVPIYSASFSSLNHITKFACGFDTNVCVLMATDTLLEKSLPIEQMCNEFRSDINGI